MDEKKLTHYQKYKETIIASRKKWLENSENKEKVKQWNREGVKRNYYKKKEIIEKYNELIKAQNL